MPPQPGLRFRQLMGESPFWMALLLCAAARWLGRSYADAPFVIPWNFWQLLDAETLRQAPLRSLYLLHMQPPLLNGLYALSLAMPGSAGPIFLQALFLSCSAIMVSIVYFFLRRYGVRPASAGAAAFLFGILPQILTYENLFFYPHLEATLLLCAMFFASRFFEERRVASFTALAACLVVLALLRSLFHLGWIAVALFAVWGIASYRHGRQTRALAVAVVAVAAVTAMYVKNLREFGTFSASSWQGVNFASMMMLAPTEKPSYPEVAGDMAARARRGEFSEAMRVAIGTPRVFEGWTAFARGCAESEAKDEALCVVRRADGKVNFNNIAMVEYSQALGRDAFRLLRLHPEVYLRHVASSVKSFLAMPSWEHPTLAVPFKPYADFWSALLLYDDRPSANRGGLAHLSDHFGQMSFLHALLVVGGLAIIVAKGMADLLGYCRKRQATADGVFPVLAVLLFAIVPNVINGAEAQRIRYSIEPMLFLALVLGATAAIERLAVRRRPASAPRWRSAGPGAGGQRLPSAAAPSASQPAMKARPPTGATAPNQRGPSSART
ncbi:hypothetical protein [Reyranella sp.]|jgi:hypothetical protein|uniref:hypothetical protein n=1 Tax=Reyranella sp. TaxID=1929291 RepID=UPI002F9279EC